MNTAKNIVKKNKTLEKLVIISSALVSIIITSWVLWLSQYGIDLTDEGYYLTWISTPYNYSVSVTQFGFIYHPLYLFLDGNITNIRQANTLITFVLAWILAYVFLAKILREKPIKSTYLLVISSSLATTSFIVFNTTLTTPNYNTLTFQALLITTTGLLLAEKFKSSLSVFGWCLIGVGGWLTFMAKPSSASLLAVVVILYLQVSRKATIRLLLIPLSIALSLLVLSALMIDGSVLNFIDRLKLGIEAASILGGGHSLLNLFRLDLIWPGFRFVITFSIFTGLMLYIGYLTKQNKNNKIFMYTGIQFSLLFITLLLISGLLPYFSIINFKGILIGVIPISATLLSISILKFNFLKRISFQQRLLVLFFFSLPYIYAFGTISNYWVHGSIVGIFWALPAFIFIVPIASRKNLLSIFLSLAIFSQIVTVMIVLAGIEKPYRQPDNLLNNNYKTQLGSHNSIIVLSEDFNRYLSEATKIVEQSKFQEDTPMIDLTGRSPTLLYAIRADSIGQAWTIGGYSGSNKLATTMLGKVSCPKLAAAWILYESDDSNTISKNILTSFGANLTDDFEVVGSLETADGSRGGRGKKVQKIYKPTRAINIAINACEKKMKNKR